MINIKISTPFPDWPLVRQTKESKGVWENCRFYVDDSADECDFWVVYEGLLKKETVKCPREGTVLITAEPPAIKKYDESFLSQFHTVITCHRDIKHPNLVFNQQALPWHVGRHQKNHINLSFTKSFDELCSISNFIKEKEISVISSAKDTAAGHIQRTEFLEQLKNYFKDRLDIFGRGINEIEDKWDAIAPYKYHIVLENSVFDDYWTEKLSDAFLAGAYVFYYGSPNLYEYFSEDSFTQIDINDVDGAVSVIEQTILSNKYDESIEAIMQARNSILYEYNLFSMLCDFCNKNECVGEGERITIRPERRLYKNILRRFKKFIYKK